jgi:hypothetical protein
MTLYIKNGNQYDVTKDGTIDIQDHLPAGVYSLRSMPMRGFYLEKEDSFSVLDRYYSDVVEKSGRIINTFTNRAANTGVLLAGEKGSGKTLLAKHVSIMLEAQGIPTIVIASEFSGMGFTSFIDGITQPIMIMIDEFEKVYGAEAQEDLLTLLDGVSTNKKLYMLTCNNRYKINENMINRPGRIFYSIDYNGIEEKFVREYCQDNLEDKTRVGEVVEILPLLSKMNFDMLQALVQEMNRYNEHPKQSLRMLNIRVESNERLFNIEVFNLDGALLFKSRQALEPMSAEGHYFQNPNYKSPHRDHANLTDEEYEAWFVEFNKINSSEDYEQMYSEESSHIVVSSLVDTYGNVNWVKFPNESFSFAKEGSFVYENSAGYVLKLSRHKEKVHDVLAHF